MKKIIFILMLVMVVRGGECQTLSPQVVPSTGEYGLAGGYSFSVTIGEPNFQYLENGAALEQGFEHGELDILTGAISGGSFVQGAIVTVPFTATGIFNTDNVFTAQLSDWRGSFARIAVNIGSLAGTISGSITATIPCYTAAGIGYRIRVVSSDVPIKGTDNGSDITISTAASASVSISDNPSGAICAGIPVTFTATPTYGGTTPSYQWYINNSQLPAASNQQFTYIPSNNDAVTCELTSNATCAKNNPTISTAIKITLNNGLTASVSIGASATTVCPATSVTFSATPTNGGTTPSYQWYVNSYQQPAASNQQFTYIPSNNDAVTCMLTSNATCATNNPATSSPINMTLKSPAIITSQPSPASQTKCVNQSATFTLTASGTAILSYQWWKKGTPNTPLSIDAYINGAVSNSYSINPMLIGEGGTYYCVVCNSCASKTSNTAVLKTGDGANIGLNPVDASPHAGGSASFSIVSDDDSGTLSFQWQQNPNTGTFSKVTDGSGSFGQVYSGSATEILTVTNIQPQMSNYQFRCIVSDACGQSLISSASTLTVTSTYTTGLWAGGTKATTLAPNNQTDWNVGTNWDNSNIPDASTDVTIPGSATYMPVIYSGNTGSSNNITISPRASLSVYTSGTLTAAGSMLIESTSAGTGAFLEQDGAIVNITGVVTIQRYLSSDGYHYISSPFSNATVNQINGFTPQNLGTGYYNPDNPNTPYSNMYESDEQHTHDIPYDYNAWLIPANNEVMPPMRAYGINMTQSAQTLNITQPGSSLNGWAGNPCKYSLIKDSLSSDYYHNNMCLNNYGLSTGTGLFSNCVTTGPADGWHLIGNPYTSPIDIECQTYLDLNDSIWDKLNATFALYEPTSQYYGVYGYRNYNLGSFGSFYPSRYISAMQGFFLKNSSIVTYEGNVWIGGINLGQKTPRLTFTNAMRTVSSDALKANYYKELPKENIQYIRLSTSMVTSNSQLPTKYNDETVIFFNPDASDGFNPKLDAIKIFNTDENTPNIYSVISKHFLVAKAFKQITDNLIIPLGYSVNTAGVYSITASEMNTLPVGTHVYLIDMKNNVTRDLTVNPSYSFNFESADNNRFFLKFSLNTKPGIQNSELCNIFANDHNLTVNYQSPNDGQAVMSIYNISGQKIRDDVRLSNGIYHTTLDVAPGIYLVKVISPSKVYVQKVYIQ